MKNSAFAFGIFSALLIGLAISFFFKGTVYGNGIVSVLSVILCFLGIGASWHTFGRANSIDKPAYENIGYRWPSGSLLWIICILGGVLGWNTFQEMSSIIYFGFGVATYVFWFLLTFIVFNLGLLPDREVAHKQFYGSDQHL